MVEDRLLSAGEFVVVRLESVHFFLGGGIWTEVPEVFEFFLFGHQGLLARRDAGH